MCRGTLIAHSRDDCRRLYTYERASVSEWINRGVRGPRDYKVFEEESCRYIQNYRDFLFLGWGSESC